MKLTPYYRKWITVSAMVLVALYSIPFTKPMFPSQLTTPIFGDINIVTVAMFVLLYSAYWVFQGLTD